MYISLPHSSSFEVLDACEGSSRGFVASLLDVCLDPAATGSLESSALLLLHGGAVVTVAYTSIFLLLPVVIITLFIGLGIKTTFGELIIRSWLRFFDVSGTLAGVRIQVPCLLIREVL